MSLCLYVSMSQCLFADSYLSIYLSFHCVLTHLSIHQFPICPRHAHSTHQSPHSARQMQTRHSTCLPPHSTRSIRLQTLHFTLQTPHLTLGTKRPTLHFTFSILNTTSENHTLQTLQSTPCTLHPPVATLRTPDANSTFHMPTSALYTLQNHTHTHREKVQDGARFQTSMGK